MKLLKLLLTTAFTLSYQSYAIAEDATDAYPVAFNNCGYTVNRANIPNQDTAIQRFYFSRDCKTLYLMPPATGLVSADVALNNSMLDRFCPALEIDTDSFIYREKRYREIERKLLAHEEGDALSSGELKRLQAERLKLREERKEFIDKYSKVEGGKAHLRIEAGITSKYYTNFVMANQHLVHNGVSIEEMEIDRGFLSVPKKTDALGSAIINMVVSGQPAKVAENNFSQTYMMHTRGDAQVVFGVGRACDIRSKMKESEAKGQKLLSEEVGKMFIADLAPNYFYQTQLSSVASYVASLRTEDFVNMFYAKYQTRQKFSFENLEAAILDSDLISVLETRFDEGIGQISPEQRDKMLEELNKGVRERFTKILLERLKLIKWVEEINPDTDLEAPASGTERELIGTIRKCRSKSALGITYSRKCRSAPLYKIKNRPGELTNEFIREAVSAINLKEEMYHNSFYTISGSTNFTYAGGSDE